jgi:site-specific DNA-methyltransferase (adenine-specific)
VIHDGSDEVLAEFPVTISGGNPTSRRSGMGYHGAAGQEECPARRGADTGSAARFFYCAKASKAERGEGNTHPTVKPLALMRYLLTLVTMPGRNLIMDPFMGSGSTGVACVELGLPFIGAESDPASFEIAERRIEAACNQRRLFS